jgi:hypothetical protein
MEENTANWLGCSALLIPVGAWIAFRLMVKVGVLDAPGSHIDIWLTVGWIVAVGLLGWIGSGFGGEGSGIFILDVALGILFLLFAALFLALMGGVVGFFVWLLS